MKIQFSFPYLMRETRSAKSDAGHSNSPNTRSSVQTTTTQRYSTQSGLSNLKRFSSLFREPSIPASASVRHSKISISQPMIGANTAFQKILPPQPDQLNPDIENFRKSSLAKNNSETAIDWAHFP